MTTEFIETGLQSELLQAVAELGYVTPTQIQAEIIPIMLRGLDVIGQAQTGTGKTAAFALPMLQNLVRGSKRIQGLVLVPTRELAVQVASAIFDYGKYSDVRVLAIYGGSSYNRQITRLKKGVDIVVGTPGRLLDLIHQKVLDLSGVRTVVLDEGDEMLSMGFIEDIENILVQTPSERQTTLFSATMPSEIRRLAERYTKEAQLVSIHREQVTVAAIEQRCYFVNENDKFAALTRLIEIESITRALIFVRTRAASTELANNLSNRGFLAEALNGDLTQEARERTLNRFRQDQVMILVATDVAARGLDIDDISHVFNYDLPEDSEIYVHRIGRTGRAGKSGVAISLLSNYESRRLRGIESFARQKIVRHTLPGIDEINKRRETQLIERAMIWLRRGRFVRERELVADLMDQGFDPLDIAAAALKVARADEKQRPILPVNEIQEKPIYQRRSENSRPSRSNSSRHTSIGHEAGMVSLSLSKGRTHGVRPSDVVGMIAFHADIPGYTIGKINIQDSRTLVDVPEQFVDQVLAKTGNYRLHRQPVSIELVN